MTTSQQSRWRDRIVRVGGVAKTLEPLCESVCRGLSMQREGCRKTHHADFYTDGLDLTTLRSAYAAVLARRQRKHRNARLANRPLASASLQDAITTAIP
jgi:hypothetical protein